MPMSSVATEKPKADYNKIVCRRIPVKLKQFAHLLEELSSSNIDPVRVKAMQSQIRKTRETCIEYKVEATAKLLGHIQQQLQLDKEALTSQIPLIKRFVSRLLDHAERLQLGQINSATDYSSQIAKRTQEQNVETSSQQPSTPSAEVQSTVPSTQNKEKLNSDSSQQNNPINTPIESKQEPTLKAEQQTNISNDENYDFRESGEQLNKGKETSVFDSTNELTIYWCFDDEKDFLPIKTLLLDFGYSIKSGQSVIEATRLLESNQNIAILGNADELPEEKPESIHQLQQLILFSHEDTIEQRLKCVRLGASYFLSRPIDSIKLLDYLDALEQKLDITPYKILVMEDSKAQAKFADKILSSANLDTCIVNDPMQILNALSNFHPDIIFMDMQMPGCNGIELTYLLRQIDRFSKTPIVFLSAEENHELQRRALTSGGNAFIEKPIQKERLLFMARLYARRSRSLQPQFTKELHTGLNSTSRLKEQLTIEAERAMRQNDSMYFAIFEVSSLYKLNEQYGYALGDRIITQLSRMLTQRLRKTDFIGFYDVHRIGVILNHCQDSDAENIMIQLQNTFAGSPIYFKDQTIPVDLAIGLAKIGADYDVLKLIKRADAALNKALEKSGSRVIWAHERQKPL